MKKILLTTVLLLAGSFAHANLASLDCDKSRVSIYVNNKLAHYQQMLADGQLSPDDVQFLVGSVNDTVEINAISCGWIKPSVAKKADFCERAKIDRSRWAEMANEGLLSAKDVEFLLGAQRDLAEMTHSKCN